MSFMNVMQKPAFYPPIGTSWIGQLADLTGLDIRTVTLMASLAVLLILVIFVVFYFENTTVMPNELSVRVKGLPEAFDGMVIVHLSDLHNNLHGERQIKIMRHILEANPDHIFFTGDLIDSRYKGEVKAFALLDEIAASGIAPLWYVPGNHEMRTLERYEKVCQKLKSLNMRVLQDEGVLLEHRGEHVTLLGVDDPMKYKKAGDTDYKATFSKVLNRVVEQSPQGFKILLSHRPDLLPLYAEAGVQLVFSGHAHGGQVRLPGIKGLYAPQQGFFPKYTAGIYHKGGTTMVVSRGLGNNVAPTRFLNRPEVLIVTLIAD